MFLIHPISNICCSVSSLYNNFFCYNNSSNNRIKLGYNSLILPSEVINKMFLELSGKERSNTASVCRFWNHLTSNVSNREEIRKNIVQNKKKMMEAAMILTNGFKDFQRSPWHPNCESKIQSINAIDPNWNYLQIEKHLIQVLCQALYTEVCDFEKINHKTVKQLCEIAKIFIIIKEAKIIHASDVLYKDIIIENNIQKLLVLNRPEEAMELASSVPCWYLRVIKNFLKDGFPDKAISSAKLILNQEMKDWMLFYICRELLKSKELEKISSCENIVKDPNLEMAFEAAIAIEDSGYKTIGLEALRIAYLDMHNICQAKVIADLLPTSREREILHEILSKL